VGSEAGECRRGKSGVGNQKQTGNDNNQKKARLKIIRKQQGGRTLAEEYGA